MHRHRSASSIDATMAEAIGPEAEDRLPEVLAALDLLGEIVTPQIHRMTQSSPASDAAT